MPALTPNFIFNMESKLRVLVEELYANLIRETWWDRVAKVQPTDAGRQVLSFVLSTAQIDKTGLDPSIQYRPITVLETEVVPKYLSTGLELQRAQLEDTDSNGLEMASKWVRDVTNAAAYNPQIMVSRAILDGYSTLYSYDSQLLFSGIHPLNARDISKGTYSNIFTGPAASLAASDPNNAAYPGALDVRVGTGAVTIDTAFAKLQKAFSYIASIKMPNGIYPRKLKPKTILAPSNLYPYLTMILDAKFISMSSAGGGGGATSIEGTLAKLGYGDVINADELNEDPNSFYIVAESAAESALGPVIYCEREPIGIRFFTGAGGGSNVESYLSENDTLKYNARGRAEVAAGEPSLIFKCSVT